jgi:PAS domain S-box-containing protein
MHADLNALMVQESPDALVALDPAGRVQLWSRGAEAVFGYAAEEAKDCLLAELVVPEGQPGVGHELARAQAGAVSPTESMRRRKDGTLIYVNTTVRAQRDTEGAVQRYFCAMSDVTPMRVERDSQLVHARYHGLLELAPDAIVIVNDTGRIVLFNARARDMFGHASADVMGAPIEVLLPARVRGGHLRHRNGYLGAPRMRPMGLGLELLGVRRNGEEFPVEISLSPIEGDTSRLVMSAIRDTSERKRIERALQEKNLELERANRAKDHFLATMSHELRTPLNAILGFTGLLLMKLPGPLNDTQQRQLELVQSSGRHLLSLINDLLDLAKIDAGHVELQIEDVPCLAVLEDIASTLRPSAEAKGLALELEPSPDTMLARADRRALHQIVLNLAGNAIKFTPQGVVTLAVSRVFGDGQDWIELEVMDTGIGISAADQARLFQAFTQVGPRSVHNQEGTGLGLHLSRRLAELMGGSLTVSSEAGVGSRFAVRVRAAGDEGR